jgi:hypothetical protein
MTRLSSGSAWPHEPEAAAEASGSGPPVARCVVRDAGPIPQMQARTRGAR